MATPRPKQFTAARGFISRGKSYNAGDPVTDRRTIARLAPYGDKYLAWKITKPTPAVDTAKPHTASEEDN